MRAVYKTAFTAALDRYIVQQASTPEQADAHAAVNLVYARLFTLMASAPGMPEPTTELWEGLVENGLAPQGADALFATLLFHTQRPPISANYIGSYLRQAGVKPSEIIMKAVGRVVAAAYREACLSATEALDLPSPSDRVWPLPPVLRRLLDLPPEPAAVVTQQEPPPAAQPLSTSGRATPVHANQSERIDVRLSVLAEATKKKKIAAKDWRPERARDVDAAVNLFIAANGDLFLSEIDQQTCAAFTELFPRLPTRYGHTKEDIEHGIAGALNRGARLAEIWKHDPIKAERDLVPTLGLGIVTHNNHIFWIGALFDFADGEGYVVPDVNLGKLKRRDKNKKKGGKRLPWHESHLKTLVSGPIWSGCADLWHRFHSGNEIFHDGWYWWPLQIVTSGARSEEPAGLMLEDVFEDVPIPFVYYRDNRYRLLNNGQSERKVPISPKLVQLGFLDFVRNLRQEGAELIYPEFFNPKQSMSFDHIVYDKVFEPLRALHFPHGTQNKRGRKDVDVHSIRTRVGSFWWDKKFEPGLRQYLMSHVPDGETASTYEEEPSIELLLLRVRSLDTFIMHIEPKTLRLRPTEWRRFGAPRGRRAGFGMQDN